MWFYLLRAYLLTGLVVHKLVWEVLKRRSRTGAGNIVRKPSPRLRWTKLAKLVILVGITIQVLLPEEWLPALRLTEDPTLVRLAGVILYTTGLVTALVARLQLGSNWSDIEDATVLADQKVIDRGIYRYIRHPIYVGDLLLLLGLELSLNSWLVIGVIALAAVVLRQAVREETMLLERLPGYAEYCLRTKRFLPFLV